MVASMLPTYLQLPKYQRVIAFTLLGAAGTLAGGPPFVWNHHKRGCPILGVSALEAEFCAVHV